MGRQQPTSQARSFQREGTLTNGTQGDIRTQAKSSLGNQELSSDQREPNSSTHKFTHHLPSLFIRGIQVGISDKSKGVVSLKIPQRTAIFLCKGL